MNILKLIERDHKAVKKIFRELEKNAESPSKRVTELVEQLILEIKLHAKVEQAVLYKRCLERNEKLHDFSMEGYIEHRLLDVVLKKLPSVTPGGDGEFKALVSVAKELFEHHAEEEEEKLIFPKIEKAFRSEELEEMGEQMIALKERERPKLEMMVGKLSTRSKASKQVERRLQ